MFKRFFDPMRRYRQRVEAIGAYEHTYADFSLDALRQESVHLGESVRSGQQSLDDALPQAFALVREAAKRTLGQRHFDVQLMGGMVIAQGAIAEMSTGEGKTLAATAPAYLHALTKKGVHVITVNDYLAQRDAVWMGQIYHALGMSTSCIIHDHAFMYDPSWTIAPEGDVLIDEERDTTGSFRVQKEFLKPVSRKEAYQADIVYGTNHEFGFDYLRDNLAYSVSGQVQRGHYFAIIDEVDSILIDEARTPLIISAPDTQAGEYYKIFARLVGGLSRDSDYVVDEKARSVQITDAGIAAIEKALSIENIYDTQHARLVHYLDESLKAKALFSRDRHYVIKNGEVIIVDEFTGRLMPGRRYSGGLHQAIEAKEGVAIKEESKTYAQITIQNYFRLYEKISGMTGTAATSSEEFHKVYHLDVVTIPTNKPRQRTDRPDLIFKNKEVKYDQIVRVVKERALRGQPVLIGTTSIDENELLSAQLLHAGVSHEILNAKNHEREGEIIAQAGRPGAVTLATNMAGRGVDIVLGGNPIDMIKAEHVKQCGGLFVLGTQRNEARRIDNQLRGRAGRQGDPGETQFFLSLEDDLMRIFGGERVQSLMTRLNMPDDVPIESGIVLRVVEEAQKKVEGLNFDARRHLLEYDDVLNKQRSAVYRRRQHMLERIEMGESAEVLRDITLETLSRFVVAWESGIHSDNDQQEHVLSFDLARFCSDSGLSINEEALNEEVISLLRAKQKLPNVIEEQIVTVVGDATIGARILSAFDMFWVNHLDSLEALMESVRMRAYGQKDPLVEYKRESYGLFKDLIANAQMWVFTNVFRGTQINTNKTQMSANKTGASGVVGNGQHVGRNDPCPCGSGKKYKKCHGK